MVVDMDGSGPGLKVPDLWARLGRFLVPSAFFHVLRFIRPIPRGKPFSTSDTLPGGGPTFPFPVWMLAELRVLTLPFEFGEVRGCGSWEEGRRKGNVKKRMGEQNNKEHSSKNR